MKCTGIIGVKIMCHINWISYFCCHITEDSGQLKVESCADLCSHWVWQQALYDIRVVDTDAHAFLQWSAVLCNTEMEKKLKYTQAWIDCCATFTHSAFQWGNEDNYFVLQR